MLESRPKVMRASEPILLPMVDAGEPAPGHSAAGIQLHTPETQ